MIAGMNKSSVRIASIVGAAVAVTAIATAAVTATVLAGDDNTLTQEQVAALLTQPPGGSTPAGTPSTTATSPQEPLQPEVWTGVPGTITVGCDGNMATLLSWSPNPGYRADDPVRGPAAEVSVRFENDSNDNDFKVTATCADGVATVTAGPDDHSGGGRGRGRGRDD